MLFCAGALITPLDTTPSAVTLGRSDSKFLASIVQDQILVSRLHLQLTVVSSSGIFSPAPTFSIFSNAATKSLSD